MAGSLFLAAGCNNSKTDKETTETDTTISTSDTVASSAPDDAGVSATRVVNKTDYAYDKSVVISGKISKETFYGAPGFGENPKTDAKEERYLLVPDKPINVIGPVQPDDDSKESKYNVSKIQLLYDENTIDMGRYLGSAVQLTGTLFGAHTGHHHTPVLMDVTQVKGQ